MCRWRAVRLRRLASKFGDIVKAHKQMIEEEEARRAAQRAAEEARALACSTHRLPLQSWHILTLPPTRCL